ncbi:hypothetical protein VNO80_20987 [Phaseolus coccineus]|uniref:Uncharacterized protein n=1 Tax=Phaseolus coccineus TaxID=3886 RepID=A0AAN9M292_PHACN
MDRRSTRQSCFSYELVRLLFDSTFFLLTLGEYCTDRESKIRQVQRFILAVLVWSSWHSDLKNDIRVFGGEIFGVNGDLAAAFQKHFLTYRGLDICINSAGIGSSIPFRNDQTDGTRTWRHTVNVNFTAVNDSTRLAIKAMQAAKRHGVIINLGSASGLYRMFMDPIYSGSKEPETCSHLAKVRLHGRSIKINKKRLFVGFEGDRTGIPGFSLLCGGVFDVFLFLPSSFLFISFFSLLTLLARIHHLWTRFVIDLTRLYDRLDDRFVTSTLILRSTSIITLVKRRYFKLTID